MLERALVSVILPTFNNEAHLREAIRSVLTQTYRARELIVVDDGSTDGTRAYVESLDNPEIRLIVSEHTGNPGRARNLALAAAQGHYIAFLDSDDWWESDKLAAQGAALTRRPECRWCYTGLRGVTDDGREIELFDRRGFVPHDGWILERLAAGGAAVTTSTVMVERALVERVGGFDERLVLAEDLDLWMRLAAQSPVAVVPRILVTRRVHGGSYSASRLAATARRAAAAGRAVRGRTYHARRGAATRPCVTYVVGGSAQNDAAAAPQPPPRTNTSLAAQSLTVCGCS